MRETRGAQQKNWEGGEHVHTRAEEEQVTLSGKTWVMTDG